MRLFFDELSVLQSHDQIELLFLHTLDLLLVQRLLVGLPLQLVLDLGARTILLVNEFILALCIGVLLLHANHLLDLSGTHVLSIAVLIEHLPVRLLFILRFNGL